MPSEHFKIVLERLPRMAHQDNLTELAPRCW
jgi:hypothetical protein